WTCACGRRVPRAPPARTPDRIVFRPGRRRRGDRPAALDGRSLPDVVYAPAAHIPQRLDRGGDGDLPSALCVLPRSADGRRRGAEGKRRRSAGAPDGAAIRGRALLADHAWTARARDAGVREPTWRRPALACDQFFTCVRRG